MTSISSHTHVASSMSVLSFYLRWSESQKPGRRKKKIHLSPLTTLSWFWGHIRVLNPSFLFRIFSFSLQIFLFPPFFFESRCNLTHITQQKLLPAYFRISLFIFLSAKFLKIIPRMTGPDIYILYISSCVYINNNKCGPWLWTCMDTRTGNNSYLLVGSAVI